ncbi:MAG: hypothetical protein GX951_00970 [Mollicutes bacterium]|nr:hypothetical protein [Mollicutes bacterium]
MKVLILSCNTGGGHNSCGKYIKEELLFNNIECDFKNYFEIVNLSKKDFSDKLYIGSLGKKGGLFKYMYKMGEAYDKMNIKSPVYLANQLHANKLYKFIDENKYDLVICPHLFPGQALTEINKKHHINFIFVATDYEYHPFTDEIKADYYVIPKGLEERFISKGIDENKLLSFGIPISSKFITNAKLIKKNNENKKNILILLGSMGFGSINKILDDLLNIKNIYITIVCGNNHKLYNELNNYNNENLNIIGFSKNINDLIKSSDIVISKPGGLSSTEIACFRKGLIHVFPIPGVETSNTEFFSKHNLSFVANNKEEIINYINLLINDNKIYNKMIESQKEMINQNSAMDLVAFIKDKY